MKNAELSESFCPLITPALEDIETWEQNLNVWPKSLQVIDSSNSLTISQLMTMMPSSSPTISYILEWTKFLWLVSENGELRISLEEYVNIETGEPFGIRFEGFDKVTTVEKGTMALTRLGHPSLTDNLAARIGGEIEWDRKLMKWVISNKSGRYGYGKDRKEIHLINVQNKFKEMGILTARFYSE